jgi:proteasome accessory factor B
VTPRRKPVEKLSRPPLARMLRIHEELKAGRDVNCSRLAATLEVSTKTVMRDIEFMRDQLMLPIEYEPAEYSYRYAGTVEAFPTVQVSEGEVVALLVAEKALQQYRGTPFEGTLHSAFSKIVSGLSEQISFDPGDGGSGISFHNIGVSAADMEVFQVLSRAMRERRSLGFAYRKLGAESFEQRLVDPHHLACVQGLWYLVAYDRDRSAMRTFALPRISQPRMGKERFERRKDFSPDRFFANSFGVMAGEGTQLVRIRFDAYAARLIRERHWHSSQLIKELDGGELELQLQVGSLRELETWLLGWAGHARVLQPKKLAESLRSAAQALLSRYEEL